MPLTPPLGSYIDLGLPLAQNESVCIALHPDLIQSLNAKFDSHGIVLLYSFHARKLIIIMKLFRI